MNFVDRIISEGGIIYLVGCINRDRLLNYYHNTNFISNDYDILILKLPYDRIVDLLTDGKVNLVGKSFGVIKYKDNFLDLSFDIAIPRIESGTIISPTEKVIIVDLARRDATLNSIVQRIYKLDDLFCLKIENIFDPYNGIEDIKNRLWRSINHDRLTEDIRMLRVIRQCAILNLELDEQTSDIILANRHLLLVN